MPKKKSTQLPLPPEEIIKDYRLAYKSRQTSHGHPTDGLPDPDLRSPHPGWDWCGSFLGEGGRISRELVSFSYMIDKENL